VEENGHTFSVDVLQEHLSGLILAEVGFEMDEEMTQPLELPSWVRHEVSDDVRFTGGALVSLTPNEASQLIGEIGNPSARSTD
jgi:CYTH domain-containing protein